MSINIVAFEALRQRLGRGCRPRSRSQRPFIQLPKCGERPRRDFARSAHGWQHQLPSHRIGPFASARRSFRARRAKPAGEVRNSTRTHFALEFSCTLAANSLHFDRFTGHGTNKKGILPIPPTRRKPRSTTADSALGRAGATGYTTSGTGAEWQRSVRRQARRGAISIARLPLRARSSISVMAAMGMLPSQDDAVRYNGGFRTEVEGACGIAIEIGCTPGKPG
jgi:hypothetical protein